MGNGMNGGLGILGVIVGLAPASWDALRHGAVPDGIWALMGTGILAGLASEAHNRIAAWRQR